MSGYRRFVAYVYEYRKGKKESNCGFIKVEVRDARCTMEVHLNIEGVTPGVECRIYGFVRKDGLMNGILLDSCETGEDSIECLIETDALSMGDSGISLGRMGGMIFTTQTGGFFGTEWDDQTIRPANFREMKIDRETDTAVEVKRREEGEQRRGQDREQTRENAGAEEREHGEGAPGKETNDEMGQSGAGERSAGMEQNPEREEIQAEEIQEQSEYGEGTSFDENWESGTGEGDEIRQEAEGKTAESEAEIKRDQEEEELAEVEVEYPGESDAADIKQAREFAEMEEKNRAADGEAEEIKAEAVSWETDRIRVNANVKPGPRLAQPERHSLQPDSEKRSQQSDPIRHLPQMERQERALESEKGRLQSDPIQHLPQMEHQERAPELEKRRLQSESAPVPSKPACRMYAPKTPVPKAEPCPPQRGFGKDMPESGTRPPKPNPGPRPSQPMPGKRPNKPSWEAYMPFNDGDMAQCWKIHPKDFSCFSRRQCALRNNRFLQYGHYNFGHLLLCRRSNGQYILGVPGSYDQQERFMANMFGFPYFKESRMIEVPKGRGGYWYRLIDAPNFH